MFKAPTIGEKNLFDHDLEIDEERMEISYRYNQNFEKILTCIKPSREFSALIKIERLLCSESAGFINKHKRYFDALRQFYVRKGVMNRPQYLPLDEKEMETFDA